MLAMEGRAATWMPAQVQPITTVAAQGHFFSKPTEVMICGALVIRYSVGVLGHRKGSFLHCLDT